MNLYFRANCIRLEKIDPETGKMYHVRLVTFERSKTARKAFSWCCKFSAEEAAIKILAHCKKTGVELEKVWNSREVIPAHFGKALEYKRAGYHVRT